jgi:peptidyl-prolyl cis-trans isomerase A (cyclophilin A)
MAPLRLSFSMEISMLKKLIGTCALLLASTAVLADNPRVLLNTSHGDIELELNAEAAPISVENFLRYADAGHYDGLIFHRVIPGFMIQGGGFDANMRQRAVGQPIKNEADNGLKNDRYTVAMARTQVRDSATSQFFINLTSNDFLNHGSRDFGYAVFGKVVAGEHVVETIAKVPTGNQGGHQNVPQNPVTIISAKRVGTAE